MKITGPFRERRAPVPWLLAALLLTVPILIAGASGAGDVVRGRVRGTPATGLTDGRPQDLQLNSSGALYVDASAGGAVTVEGTTADGAAFSDNPVIVGGVDGAGDAQQLAVDTAGQAQVDVLTVGGQSPAYGAGAVAATVPRMTLSSDDPAVVDLAAIEVLLGTIDADTGSILTDTNAMVVDLAAIEVTQDALVVDLAAIEVLLTGIDSDTNTIQSDTTAILADTAALVVDAAALEVLNTDIETNTDSLAVVGGGTEAAAVRVTLANDSTGVVSVDDNAGALTVDWAGTAPPIGAGTEAGALRVTLATDSTGVVSIDDNSSTITVDGTVAVSGIEDVYVHPTAGELAITRSTLELASASVTQITAAPSGSNLAIVGLMVNPSAAMTVQIQEDTGGTPVDVTGAPLFHLAATGGITLGYPLGKPVLLWEVTDDTNLGILASTTDAVSIVVWTVEIPD